MTIPITEEQWDEFLNLLENRLDQQDTEIKLLKDRVTELEEQQQKKNKPKAKAKPKRSKKTNADTKTNTYINDGSMKGLFLE